MYDPYIMRRTQIYLDDHDATELERRARSSGRTRSAVIREAIGRYLVDEPTDEAQLRRFREAADAAFGTAPHLPGGQRYVDQQRSIRSERGERIRRTWTDRDDEPG